MKRIFLALSLVLVFSACEKQDNENTNKEKHEDECTVGEICWYPNEKVEIAEKSEDIENLSMIYFKGKEYIYHGGKEMINRMENVDYQTFVW